MKATSTYFPALTGLRFLAALMVYLHHFNPAPSDSSWFAFFQCFDAGVMVFFVLSGFLLYYRYAEQLQPTFRSFWTYFTNRFARIYPVYFLLTSLSFVYAYSYYSSTEIATNFSFTHYWLNISFLKGFFSAYQFTGIAQGWTLTVEECFYFLLLPAVIILPLLRKYMLWIPLVAALMGITLFLLLKPFHIGFLNDWRFVLKHTLFGRMTEFVIGMLIAKIMLSGREVKTRANLALIGLILLFIGLWLVAIMPQYISFAPFMLNTLAYQVLLPLVAGLLLWGLATQNNWFTAFFASRPMELLGKASYVFYLIHMGVFQQLSSKVIGDKWLLNLIALTVLSLLIWYLIEEPLNKLTKKVMMKLL